jgi:hypothetical protein
MTTKEIELLSWANEHVKELLKEGFTASQIYDGMQDGEYLASIGFISEEEGDENEHAGGDGDGDTVAEKGADGEAARVKKKKIVR